MIVTVDEIDAPGVTGILNLYGRPKLKSASPKATGADGSPGRMRAYVAAAGIAPGLLVMWTALAPLAV